MALVDRLVARQGDTLDLLLWRERSLGPSALAAVLAANPGLAALEAELPLGTPVDLPAAIVAVGDTPATRPLVQLWD